MIRKIKWWILPLCIIITVGLVFMARLINTEMVKQNTRVILYDAPQGIAPSEAAQLWVNDQPVFVYQTAVNHNRSFSQHPTLGNVPVSYFDFQGKVEVRIQAEDVNSAVIRPLSLGVTPKIADGQIYFTLNQPAMLTIEINGDPLRAFHLFANEIEEHPPSKEDENVLYFGPGLHELPVIRLRDNQTVYIAGGAVVRSKIVADKAQNIRVTGRGIIDGSTFDRWTQLTTPIDFRLCTGVRIEGILLLDPAGWTVNTFACRDVLIDNIKIISARANGDGITAQSCQNLVAKNSFVRSWDDSLVVKNYGNGISSNILFKDMMIWTDLAQSCEIGYETKGPEMSDITFDSITVLHNFHKPVMSIHNSDQAAIRDVVFKNIIVEDAQMGEGDAVNDGFLIDLAIGTSIWTTSKERGSINNVLFENIRVLDGKNPPSRLMGYDAQHGISDVTIRNLSIHGKRIRTLEDGGIRILDHVEKVRLE